MKQIIECMAGEKDIVVRTDGDVGIVSIETDGHTEEIYLDEKQMWQLHEAVWKAAQELSERNRSDKGVESSNGLAPRA